jgi:hypothetical protein
MNCSRLIAIRFPVAGPRQIEEVGIKIVPHLVDVRLTEFIL